MEDQPADEPSAMLMDDNLTKEDDSLESRKRDHDLPAFFISYIFII